ncbi:MAG: hypothetical protein OEV44_05890 [Spirochaetota bacterium]|nr:hypothetical protein [Spirochaetota bacterium]
MNKRVLVLLVSLVMLTFFMLGINNSFAKGGTLSGGDTKRNPVLGLNFIGGHYDFGTEVEVDFKVGSAMSIAPRLGLTGFNWISPGVSVRFAIIEGVRPHGFWVGPSCDLIFGKYKNRWNAVTGQWENKTFLAIAPAVEFGWRYTFDFGLSLQPLTRLGVYLGDGTGFFWVAGFGVGYAF